MNTLNKILLLFLVITTLFSCEDINNLSSKSGKIPVIPTVSKEDSLNFLDWQTIDFGDVRWQRIPSQFVIFNNNSGKYPVTIYSLKLKNNFGFRLYPEKGFPVVIPPNQSNADNRLLAEWNTSVVPAGSYQDTVIVNDSQLIILLIKGNSTN